MKKEKQIKVYYKYLKKKLILYNAIINLLRW